MEDIFSILNLFASICRKKGKMAKPNIKNKDITGVRT
jgi:hypothetical protein